MVSIRRSDRLRTAAAIAFSLCACWALQLLCFTSSAPLNDFFSAAKNIFVLVDSIFSSYLMFFII